MSPENKQIIETSIRHILTAVGENPDRAGLKETPARVARMYEEIFTSLEKKSFDDGKVFEADKSVNDEIVTVKHVPFYSMCEHHLLPFFGTVSVGYIPQNGKIIGLSKIPRLIEYMAAKPSVQEEITSQIGKEMTKILAPQGVAVVITARHMCVEMRGIKKLNSQTTTSYYDGIFKKDRDKRAEFLQEINR